MAVVKSNELEIFDEVQHLNTVDSQKMCFEPLKMYIFQPLGRDLEE
jgi:hypothetical protein